LPIFFFWSPKKLAVSKQHNEPENIFDLVDRKLIYPGNELRGEANWPDISSEKVKGL
jgi:hypothetical protein